METARRTLRYALLFAGASALVCLITPRAVAQTPAAPLQHASPAHTPETPGILNRDQAAPLVPTSVFFNGQSAPTQGRNSAGVRFPGGKLALMALVDTSGYSSSVQQRYQAYLITEVPLDFGGHTVAPGAYGFGFVADNRVLLMNIAGDELFHTSSARDEQLHRPTPLQILPNPASANSYLLYLGRNYIVLSAANATNKAPQ